MEDFKRLWIKRSVVTKKSMWWAAKGYDAQMASFVAALLSGKPPEVTVVDGVRATLGSLRMLESARGGYPCTIDTQQFIDAT